MSNLQKLQDAIHTKYPDLTKVNSADLVHFIEEYTEQEKEEYKKLKSNKALTFGKHKGFTVAQINATEKGADYLGWLLSQSWLTEDKFAGLINDIKALGIKKRGA